MNTSNEGAGNRPLLPAADDACLPRLCRLNLAEALHRFGLMEVIQFIQLPHLDLAILKPERGSNQITRLW